MKKLHSRFRIFLLTFAFGLVCVPFINGIHDNRATVSLELPEISIEAPIVVYPKYTSEMGDLPYFPENESSGDGSGIEENEAKKKVKKSCWK